MNFYDSERFVQSMEEFNALKPIGSIYENSFRNNKLNNEARLVEIIAYCLNPNHFHLLIKQVAEKGISKFMHRLSLGYTKYFNEKYERSGALFQGKYKFKHVSDNDYLLHLSAYVNLNDKVHKLGNRMSKLVRSSWSQYSDSKIKTVASLKCTTLIILSQFKNKKGYEGFAKETIDHIIETRTEDKVLDELLLE